ncbi:hypothetical protein N7516_010110 [Penicillium verrucosum]|uniref:uncharacterized protein n=1 Tax=Penicillium verrucosum TaxID=60171 RepID=UPI002545AAB9|nr:uncharacterized protein N7516_010110 [Penicillium verrucosum]KAJ5922407.1 hypothetical protein N7516_010110 [Penicillium verrucosum]
MASSCDNLQSDTLSSVSTQTPSHPSHPSLPSLSPTKAPLPTTVLLRDALIATQDRPHLPQGTNSVLCTQISESTQEEDAGLSLPSSTLRSFRRKSINRRSKKALSTDCIPRQTILKALASRASILGNTTNMSTSSLSSMLANKSTQASPPSDSRQRRGSNDSSHNLSAALSNLQLNGYLDRSPTTARLILQSPCYFHQRFDDAVNIKKGVGGNCRRRVAVPFATSSDGNWMRNVMIVTKARDNSLVHLTREVAEWLLSTSRYGSELGVNVYVDAKLRNSKRFDAPGLLQKDPMFAQMLHFWTPDLCWTSPDKFDLVLTLGGDGTVLFTSWLFQRVVPPVLCFSLGSLGFLTNFEFSDYKSQLNAVMGEVGMRVNLRMRFTCTVYRKDRSKGAEVGAVEEGEQFELYADDELLTVVQADGCIFSTPTGSTAYSLSAGGSLMHPSIPGILLTPICPHTLSFRPMVLSDSHLLRIAVPKSSRSTAYCSFDGKGRVELRQGDYVTVEASQYPFPTVVSNNNEWFTSVQRALRWNTRGAVQKSWDGGDADADLNSDPNEDEQWDIDMDTMLGGTDSGIGPSEDGDALSPNPMRRQMSLLNM